MRVAMYYNNRDVRVEEMPLPDAGPGEILVKVLASGVCGSDVMEWYRVKKAPLVLGHEIAGEVAKIGEGVRSPKKGDRVFVSHHIPCNTCRYCLAGHHTACDTLHNTNFFPGGFAEYIRVPSLNVDRGVFILPREISFEEGTFVEPLACVLRGLGVARLRPGQSVLILGSGISGLLNMLAARALGAGRIIATDIEGSRLKKAEQLGADGTIDARADVAGGLRRLNDNRLADLVIVCTGASPAFTQALECVDRGGTVLFFAPTEPGATLAVPVNEFWRNEIKLLTSYGNSPSDAAAAIELVRLGRVPVAKMITHRFGLSGAGKAFQLVSEARGSIKVIIEPQK